jgi:bifunctional oligoribonuclease and PAP phosphatase NrnA
VTTEQVGTEEEWARAVKALDGATEICLACHIRPDGDALGSMLAVAHALRARCGPPPTSAPPFTAPVAIVASFGDLPFEIPRILNFLPGADLLSPSDGFPSGPRSW